MKYRTKSFTGAEATLLLAVATLLAIGSLGIAAANGYSPFPKPDAGYVTDLAGVLSHEQEEKIETQLYATEKSTGVEIIVVIINSIGDYSGTPNKTIEDFAKGLFDAYRIGNVPKNDGALLLVAVKDRKARIELGAGYGHSRDSDATRIMDHVIVPRFRQGRYVDGIADGVTSLTREFGGEVYRPGWLPWVLPGVILALILMAISLFRHGKRGWGWVCLGLIFVAVLAIVWLGRRVGESIPEAIDAGGLGGFGGGFSGGGGATGSW